METEPESGLTKNNKPNKEQKEDSAGEVIDTFNAPVTKSDIVRTVKMHENVFVDNDVEDAGGSELATPAPTIEKTAEANELAALEQRISKRASEDEFPWILPNELRSKEAAEQAELDL